MFKFRDTLSLALVLCFMVTLLIPGALFAKEKEMNFTKFEKSWTENGIDKATQSKLKEKIKKGLVL